MGEYSIFIRVWLFILGFLFRGVFVDFIFVLNSLLLGVGLSMDAFSVSLANGLNEPKW